jgi:hypothetical protein
VSDEQLTYNDLFVSQTAWTEYQSALRILKHYDLPFSHVAASRMSFSSYPGTLYSSDDFYVLSSYVSSTTLPALLTSRSMCVCVCVI